MTRNSLFAVFALVAAIIASGCSSARTNIAYRPLTPQQDQVAKPVVGALVSVVDTRENTRVYPKQVIMHTTYSGDKSFDINDRTVDEVVADAAAFELRRLGVRLLPVPDIEGPLDKESYRQVAGAISARYPEVKVAFGIKVKEFIASSERKLVYTDVHVKAAVELYVLDVAKSDLVWSEYNSEWTQTVAAADREYMIDQLDDALAEVMDNAFTKNMKLRDTLVGVGYR